MISAKVPHDVQYTVQFMTVTLLFLSEINQNELFLFDRMEASDF